MNPYEPIKAPEHIVGFEKAVAPSPENLRAVGFKPTDVICWANGDGVVFFQNGEEFYRPRGQKL